MYLVHKCSIEFFRWMSANSDKLADIIKEAKQMKSDLEKMDANVAQMYASKCQKSQEDLLALMKKGGWLTASEAKDWGFVDEITDYEEDAAPVITDSIAADMAATGIPIPAGLEREPSASIFARCIEAITNFFTNPNTHIKMEQTQNPQQVQEQAQVQTPAAPDTQALEQQHQAAIAAKDQTIAAKDQEIARLQSELEAMKKAPGASTSQVVEAEKKDNPEEKPSAVEDFFATRQRAAALYNSIP
jgi:enoyl-CoA hydratase/carnithine racemase